jgi:hypothetical protein
VVAVGVAVCEVLMITTGGTAGGSASSLTVTAMLSLLPNPSTPLRTRL